MKKLTIIYKTESNEVQLLDKDNNIIRIDTTFIANEMSNEINTPKGVPIYDTYGPRFDLDKNVNDIEWNILGINPLIDKLKAHRDFLLYLNRNKVEYRVNQDEINEIIIEIPKTFFNIQKI